MQMTENSENKRIKIENSTLNKSIVSFAKNNQDGNSIRDSEIFASDLKKLKGSFRGNIDNCLAENIEFGTNSGVFYEELDMNHEARYLKINNLSLEKNAILKITDCNSNDKMSKICNSRVEGHFVLDTNTCLEINSAILKEGRTSIRTSSGYSKVMIENSVLSGNNDFRNIVGISCIEASNSRITSKDYLKINDEVISNMDISLSEKDVERYNQKSSADTILDNQVGQADDTITIGNHLTLENKAGIYGDWGEGGTEMEKHYDGNDTITVGDHLTMKGDSTIGGGGGNDVISIGKHADIQDTSKIDGGSGFDTLKVADNSIDFSHVRNIEKLDIKNGEKTQLSLSADDVKDMLRDSTESKLKLDGDSNDEVTLTGGNWSKGASNDGYTSYSDGTTTIEIKDEVQNVIY